MMFDKHLKLSVEQSLEIILMTVVPGNSSKEEMLNLHPLLMTWEKIFELGLNNVIN